MTDRFIRPYIYAVSFLFLGSLLIGYLTPNQYQQEISKALLAYFSPLKSSTQLQVFTKIFLNNYLSTLLTLLIGLLFGLGPILFLIINGYVLGNLISFASARVSMVKVFAAIVPHGIFEVPAVLIASSYGLWWGVKQYRKFRYKDDFDEIFTLPLKRYVNLVVPLLLIGAFVEAYITPLIIRLVV